MKSSEKVYISAVSCESVLDDYEKGEVASGTGSYWDSSDLRIDKSRPYDSVGDALKAVCDANAFSFNEGEWENFGVECGDDESDFSRFDTSVLVDVNNAEVSDAATVERWKAGKTKLWSCHVSVWLAVRTSRGLTEEEANEWNDSAKNRERK